ncbi:type II toxin-antitoxin system RelE/ParE family toxin [Fusobacterium simiae]|uniref:Type II toxin-antitoxin system RelE/ParE family toxin n=1 Tax=Fusobacterium simiae TaxID=855 RepID=A0ABT4DJG7_FUSSI|nr:type II toxin-antitoxin system RelE/ParE family toxin [Fusobacterium simiae]MCY7008735.1 type II toxin-antitoxin system RelE/ParE family toxin [Fusobacterium simiae]
MYTVKTTLQFDKEFKKLDKFTQKILASWIDKNLEGCENPRIQGKGLNPSGQWRYRIGDYRLICLIEDDELIILALTVGHRKNIYEK